MIGSLVASVLVEDDLLFVSLWIFRNSNLCLSNLDLCFLLRDYMNWHKLLETNPLVERLYELSSFHVCNLVWTRSLAICSLWVLGMTWYLSLSFWMDLFVVCHFDYINQKNYWPLDKQPGPFLLVEYTDDFPNRNHGTTLQLYTIINLDERTLSWSDSLPLVRGSSKHLYIHTINLIASCLLAWCISS